MAEATLRKFISVVPDEEGKTTGAFAATKSVNRMGHAVTGIGKSFLQVNELVKFQNEWILGIKDKEIKRIDEQYKKEKDQEKEEIEKKKKRTGREQDKTASKLQTEGKNLAKKLYKKEGKKKKTGFGWAESLLKALAPIFAPLKWFVTTVITYAVFKWIGDPKNKERIDKFIKFISALGKFALWLTENSIGLLMDGVTKTFSWDPDKNAIENTFETMFGALQILGGLGGLWAVSRLLMPWKILGDVKAMMALGSAVTAAEAAGCGPRRWRKPRKPRFDPKRVRQRAQNIRRIRRNRRLAKLYKKLTALQEAGARLVRRTAKNTKALVEASQKALKSEIKRLNKIIDERAAARALREAAEKKAAKTVTKRVGSEVAGAVTKKVGSEAIETGTKKVTSKVISDSLSKADTAIKPAITAAKETVEVAVEEGSKQVTKKVVVQTQKEVVEEVLEQAIKDGPPKANLPPMDYSVKNQKPKTNRLNGVKNWISDQYGRGKRTVVAVYDTGKQAVVDAGKFLWNQVIIPTGKGLVELGGIIDRRTAGIRQSIASAPGKLVEAGTSLGKGIADKWKSFDEFIKNPEKLMEVISKSLSGKINGFVKENPLIKNIGDVAKNPGKTLPGLYQNVMDNPILKEWKTAFLDGSASGAQKIDAANAINMGPIDVLIDAAMAIFDYAYLGESPINAFAKAAGSFVGYGVGFTAASLIPGAQGWGSFLGGIAGAILGEQAGNLITQGIGKVSEAGNVPGPGGLYNMRDPLAKAILGNKDHPQNRESESAENPFYKPDFKERPVLRHWDAAPFEFGNPALEGDAKGKPYSEGGFVPLEDKKPAFKMPAYMNMMSNLVEQTPYRMQKMREKINITEINTTMTELSERKVRRVKEFQMHTHVVHVTQPVVQTRRVPAPPPEIHYSSVNPHIHMFK